MEDGEERGRSRDGDGADPAQDRRCGFGRPGDHSGVEDAKRRGLLTRWAERERFVSVELPADMARGFYEGFSNQTLWPLFHNFPFLLRFEPADWEAYVEANRLFYEAVVNQLRPGNLVWVHDYQLMLVPAMLRERVPEASVGFFLHIPFPPSTAFRILPRREELLRGLLGADFLAFHTHRYVQHFRDSWPGLDWRTHILSSPPTPHWPGCRSSTHPNFLHASHTSTRFAARHYSCAMLNSSSGKSCGSGAKQ